ncbi:MAG: hypothetical protein VW378_07885 [bacterium]
MSELQQTANYIAGQAWEKSRSSQRTPYSVNKVELQTYWEAISKKDDHFAEAEDIKKTYFSTKVKDIGKPDDIHLRLIDIKSGEVAEAFYVKNRPSLEKVEGQEAEEVKTKGQDYGDSYKNVHVVLDGVSGSEKVTMSDGREVTNVARPRNMAKLLGDSIIESHKTGRHDPNAEYTVQDIFEDGRELAEKRIEALLGASNPRKKDEEDIINHYGNTTASIVYTDKEIDELQVLTYGDSQVLVIFKDGTFHLTSPNYSPNKQGIPSYLHPNPIPQQCSVYRESERVKIRLSKKEKYEFDTEGDDDEEYDSFALSEIDKVLLATDGLWDNMSPEEVIAIIKQEPSKRKAPSPPVEDPSDPNAEGPDSKKSKQN